MSSELPSGAGILDTASPSSLIPPLFTHCSQLSFEFLIGQLMAPYFDKNTKAESILGGAKDINCFVSPNLRSITVPF